jgi:hypothetical protein
MDVSRIEIIQELLALEEMNLVRRLMQATAFVPPSATNAYAVVEEIDAQMEEHSAALVELLLKEDVTPGFGAPDPRCAELHFRQLDNVLPALARDLERMIRIYERSLQGLADEPEAAETASHILARHRENLEKVQGLIKRTPGVPAAKPSEPQGPTTQE